MKSFWNFTTAWNSLVESDNLSAQTCSRGPNAVEFPVRQQCWKDVFLISRMSGTEELVQSCPNSDREGKKNYFHRIRWVGQELSCFDVLLSCAVIWECCLKAAGIASIVLWREINNIGEGKGLGWKWPKHLLTHSRRWAIMAEMGMKHQLAGKGFVSSGRWAKRSICSCISI